MFCELHSADLSARGASIVRLLTPLTGTSRVAYQLLSVRGEIVIAVFSGSRPITDFRDWRFTTVVRKIRGAYFERWLALDESRKTYYLDRAYLHLYWHQTEQEDESEFMALHCDPNEANDTGLLRHALYKRGPHIHVTAAKQPLPHSHFALNASQLTEVLASIDALSGAVGTGIAMLKDQVLDVFDAHEIKAFDSLSPL